MIREVVYYSGRVQGVGFRYTASHLAREFTVTGVVRNLADGRVELIAEGERSEVKAFLAAVADRMNGNIKHIDQVEMDATGEYSRFEVVK